MLSIKMTALREIKQHLKFVEQRDTQWVIHLLLFRRIGKFSV